MKSVELLLVVMMVEVEFLCEMKLDYEKSKVAMREEFVEER